MKKKIKSWPEITFHVNIENFILAATAVKSFIERNESGTYITNNAEYPCGNQYIIHITKTKNNDIIVNQIKRVNSITDI